MKAYVGIGTNMGDSSANIRCALGALKAIGGVTEAVCSRIVESEPWGYDSDNAYLNAVVALSFDAPFDPLWLLDRCQEIERSISTGRHRDSEGGYIDREIDIDIIAIDCRVLRLSRLKVPHPLMHRRRFVLEPMLEVAGEDWRHPLFGLNIPAMLRQLDTQNNTKYTKTCSTQH